MEKVTRNLPEGPARRAARIAQVGARYGFGYVFGRGLFFGRRSAREDPRRIGARVRLALEELGPTFVELARFLAARRDLLSPDVTTQLANASTPLAPVPFGEVRSLLQNELGNGLERLFADFDESPVRVGTLTQSHRATLPGDRPALVVVSRPGVRGDLLAMRPVADLVRRRTSRQDPHGVDTPGLPLDPVVAVGEFARHVAHRRDMFFAAQTTRRLRDLRDEGLGLRVPELYRRYSTSRCATFETPEDPAPPDRQALRVSSETLVRLAVQEGVFFADVTAERFVVSGDGVWLADPTESFALDPERLRGLAEVLAAIGRGDVEGVARAFPLLGCRVPRDTRILGRELRDVLGSLGGPLWREHSLREMWEHGLEAMRRGGAALPADVAQLLASLVVAEGLVERPGEDGPGETRVSTEVAAEAGEELVSRFRDPRYVAERAARRLVQPEAYAEYPRQLHSLLDELKDGEIEVVFRHRGIDDLISRVDILANRLVFALLIAALIVGSSLLGIFGETGFRLLGVSVFGLVGFVIAAMLGLLLLIGIVRSGRL